MKWPHFVMINCREAEKTAILLFKGCKCISHPQTKTAVNVWKFCFVWIRVFLYWIVKYNELLYDETPGPRCQRPWLRLSLFRCSWRLYRFQLITGMNSTWQSHPDTSLLSTLSLLHTAVILSDDVPHMYLFVATWNRSTVSYRIGEGSKLIQI
jgi:hypothetical protein